jgi:hypothetical protein
VASRQASCAVSAVRSSARAVGTQFLREAFELRAKRAGANNLTGHRNPTAVNAVGGVPQYLPFFGDEGRHFVLRIRVF